MQSMVHSTFVFKWHKADCTPRSLLAILISCQNFVSWVLACFLLQQFWQSVCNHYHDKLLPLTACMSYAWQQLTLAMQGEP